METVFKNPEMLKSRQLMHDPDKNSKFQPVGNTSRHTGANPAQTRHSQFSKNKTVVQKGKDFKQALDGSIMDDDWLDERYEAYRKLCIQNGTELKSKEEFKDIQETIIKINKKFEKKELLILLFIVVVSIAGTILYEKNQEDFFPNMFKEKYEKEKNVLIEGLKAELLNNKVVSSNDKFIYKFTYLIKKENKEFLCTTTNVEINKIQDNFVFKNFSDLKEECYEK